MTLLVIPLSINISWDKGTIKYYLGQIKKIIKIHLQGVSSPQHLGDHVRGNRESDQPLHVWRKGQGNYSNFNKD
jgi:hypothetical protein